MQPFSCDCRGLYLALLYYSDEDRILATADDNIPIVEVGDEYNRGTLGADISWLNRVSGWGEGEGSAGGNEGLTDGSNE